MIFEKHPNALDLNFEALGDAGITIDQINRSLAREFDADYQKFLEQKRAMYFLMKAVVEELFLMSFIQKI